MRKPLMLMLALAGCTSAPASQGPLPSDPAMKSYIRCNLTASKRIAHQQGDPVSLAVAAQGVCGNEAADLADALASMHGPAWASHMMNKFEPQQIKSNAALIVRLRS